MNVILEHNTSLAVHSFCSVVYNICISWGPFITRFNVKPNMSKKLISL